MAAHHDKLSRFWLESAGAQPSEVTTLAGRRLLLVDAEDTFAAMLAHQLRSLGLTVTICRFDADFRLDEHHVVVVVVGTQRGR